jgi:amyloid beta precursor protein binding protein 1
MHSSTASYLALQGLYRAQFQQDLQEYRVQLQAMLRKIGLPEDAISDSEVESFVKNTNGVALIKGTSISSRRGIDGELKSMIGELYLLHAKSS